MWWACPVALLDEQSSASGMHSAGSAAVLGRYGSAASRFFNNFTADHIEPFFYTAKPSTAEREAGTKALPNKGPADLVGRDPESPGTRSPRAGAGRASERANVHPTVKGLGLMRHFVRLTTAPDGVVLDLFGGSGTTGAAAVIEGRRAVLVEMMPEYAAIARARVAHWEKVGPPERVRSRPAPVDERQGSLFGGMH
jgi:DNA modification methylase